MTTALSLITFIFGLIAALNALAGLVGKIEEFWRSRARFSVFEREAATGGRQIVLVNVGATPAQNVTIAIKEPIEQGEPIRRDMLAPKDEVILDIPLETSDTLIVIIEFQDVAKRFRRSTRRLKKESGRFMFEAGSDIALGLTFERQLFLGDRSKLLRY